MVNPSEKIYFQCFFRFTSTFTEGVLIFSSGHYYTFNTIHHIQLIQSTLITTVCN